MFRMQVLPEKLGEFVQVVRSGIEPTRTETGCLGYYACHDIHDENTFMVFELWDSQLSLNVHIKSKRFQGLLIAMDLLSAPPEIQYHMIDSTQGIELIEALLGRKQNGDVAKGGWTKVLDGP